MQTNEPETRKHLKNEKQWDKNVRKENKYIFR